MSKVVLYSGAGSFLGVVIMYVYTYVHSLINQIIEKEFEFNVQDLIDIPK